MIEPVKMATVRCPHCETTTEFIELMNAQARTVHCSKCDTDFLASPRYKKLTVKAPPKRRKAVTKPL